MKRRCRSWKSLIPLVLAVILLGISVNTGILPVLADPAEENAQNAFAQEIPAALPEEVEGEGEMKGATKEALADPAEENALNALAQEIPAALPEEVEGEGETIGAAKEALADPAEENAPNALAQETPAALPEEGEGEEETKGVTKEAPKIAAEGLAEEAVEPTIAGPSAVSMTYGDDGKTVSVTATAAAGHIITGYQWYHNTTDSNIGGTAVSEATSDSYTIPQKTPAGPHYYYCVVSTERTDNGQTTTKASSAAAVTIEPATLTVKAVVKSKDYGGTDPALNYTVTGFKAGDNLLIMSGRLERETGENAGNYRINQGTLSAGSNYTISYTGAYFKISPVRLTVKAEAMSKTYGDTDPELTYTVTGLKNGDTESVMSGEQARKAGESIGSYAISQGTLSAGNNYTMSYTGAALTIDPARLTVTADTKSKTYGDNDPELTYTVSGFKNGDTESVMTGELAREAGEDAGKYAIIQGTVSAGDNYTIIYTGAALTIDPAPLTVKADPKSKTYGDNDPELTYTVNGFKNGDTESVVSGEPAREAGEDAGDYAIIQGTATAGDNYTIICTGTALTIDPAPLTVTTPDAEKVYDGTPLAAHGKLEGLVSGETATLTSTGTLTEVGTAPNTYVITWDGTANESNYTIVSENLGTLTVTEAPPVSYKCVEGDNSSWQKEDAAGLRFVYKRPVNDEETFSHFTGVNVDGKKIAETAYDAAAGSVVITLKAEYLNGLKPGKHTFEALFDDGDSDTIQFTVAEKAEPTPTLTPAPAVPAPAIMQTPAPIKPSSVPSVPKTPATGDENQPLFWLFWLLAGACGVIGAFAVRRRKKA